MAKRGKNKIEWDNTDWEQEEEIIWVSKSEIKRDAEALKNSVKNWLISPKPN